MKLRSFPLTLLLTALSLLVTVGCNRAQDAAVYEYALDLCKTMPHGSAAACPTEVERNFPRCSPPFLAKKSTAEAFAECLGFVVLPKPVEPTAVGHCDGPRIKAKISLALAKTAPWEGSALRELDGQSLYVATVPTISTTDLRSLRLADHGGERMVSVELAPEAAKKLEEATKNNIGSSMVLGLNNSETAMKIAAAIPGPKLVLGAPDAKLDDVCHAP